MQNVNTRVAHYNLWLSLKIGKQGFGITLIWTGRIMFNDGLGHLDGGIYLGFPNLHPVAQIMKVQVQMQMAP